MVSIEPHESSPYCLALYFPFICDCVFQMALFLQDLQLHFLPCICHLSPCVMQCLIVIGFGGVGLQIKLENRTKLFVREGTSALLSCAFRFSVFSKSACRPSFVSRSVLFVLKTVNSSESWESLCCRHEHCKYCNE